VILGYLGAVMKTTLLTALTIVAALSSSCNTFIGFGRDMRIAGESMERTAEKASGGNSSSTDTTNDGGAPIY
jgi:predicted small secreted protein